MAIIIRSKFSDKIGTHYGVYLDSLLIHYEFSRAAAEEVTKEIASGKTLYEIIYNQINKEFTRKNSREIEQLQAQIILQSKEIERLKKTIADREVTHSINKNSTRRSPSSLLLNKLNKSKKFTSDALKNKHSLSIQEADELQKLLTDMKDLDFSWSNELSNHIINNNLKEQYPNISGIVKMKNSNNEWDFEGGFPDNIYRIICEELNLKKQNTTAKAIGFKPYKDI